MRWPEPEEAVCLIRVDDEEPPGTLTVEDLLKKEGAPNVRAEARHGVV